jgi:hypothetical protein
MLQHATRFSKVFFFFLGVIAAVSGEGRNWIRVFGEGGGRTDNEPICKAAKREAGLEAFDCFWGTRWGVTSISDDDKVRTEGPG